VSKQRQHSDDIYVGAHYRVRGEAFPKWILIHVGPTANRMSTLSDIRGFRFKPGLDDPRLYFKRQLNAVMKAQDLVEHPDYIMLAVR